jgi:hypothetical protein
MTMASGFSFISAHLDVLSSTLGISNKKLGCCGSSRINAVTGNLLFPNPD